MTKTKHFSMIRSFHFADWFTLANAACGVGALFAMMSYMQSPALVKLYLACALIPLALVFDILDGRIARWRQQNSVLGIELDSLADLISFGVAPVAIAFGAGMNGGWDVVILIYFMVCGVSRLARYNVTAESLAQVAARVEYFEGTPIPSSLVLVIIIAFSAGFGATGDQLWFGVTSLGPWQLHPLVLIFALSGTLMISRTLHIPKL
ncbi:MAG: CDP-alcohol phosphatidyltransferase family protein [Gammaproteobacteria bacterium]|nr:CDP-alcohol phosphatidyltransferase family protein [Gammaproteobacteria bacterium]